MRQSYAADFQRQTRTELVRVPAKADARDAGVGFGGHVCVPRRKSLNPGPARNAVLPDRSSAYPLKLTSRFSWARKNSASSRSAGVVIFMLRGEPITTCTGFPLRSISEA